MTVLRVALGQARLVVGDLAGNSRTVCELAARAVAEGADVLVLPEMTLTGYQLEDLTVRRSLQDASAQALADLVRELPPELAVVVGYLDRDPESGRPRNCSALVVGGRVAARYAKHHLPNYGVFDEVRHFAPGRDLPVVTVAGTRVAMVICEDLWFADGPAALARAAGVEVLLCLNGSPYERGKADLRESLIAARAREVGAAVVYVNQVGGQDEVVFDGQSFVVDPAGRLLARLPAFTEDLVVVDLGAHSPGPICERLGPEAELWAALVTGLRDYVEKNAFPSVVVSVSGGIDSALVATLAVDALGPARVHTVAMPSAYSSQHSLDDAAELARRQGTQHRVLPIAGVVDAYHAVTPLTGLAAENLQARVRGTLLMALSNAEGHLPLACGNKSELATGFSTLYGDSAGGFSPIKDVPKTWVWRLASWRNTQGRPPIPENSITKPPSAELAPGQLDSDRLPSYDQLDPALEAYIEGDLGRPQLRELGFADPLIDRVVALVDAAEYKRRQNPPGTKITGKAFGRDRRLPITSRWHEPPAERTQS